MIYRCNIAVLIEAPTASAAHEAVRNIAIELREIHDLPEEPPRTTLAVLDIYASEVTPR